jgi:hypothetical protein
MNIYQYSGVPVYIFIFVSAKQISINVTHSHSATSLYFYIVLAPNLLTGVVWPRVSHVLVLFFAIFWLQNILILS